MQKLLPSGFRRQSVGIIAVLALALLPLISQRAYLLHLMIIWMLYAAVASSWDLSMGYGGIFNFAHPSFFILGAYGAAVLAKTLHRPGWVAVLGAVTVAVVAAVIVSLPVLRVKGIFVPLITFAFSQVCLHVILSQGSYTGGSRGLSLIPSLRLFSLDFGMSKVRFYYLALAVLLAGTCYLRRLVSSYFGRSIVALRDNEPYAVSLGIGLARQRVALFAPSAVVPGLAGGVYTFYLGVVSPDLFGFPFVSVLLSSVLLGGVGTIYGSILGALALTVVSEALVDWGPWRFIVVSVVTVMILIYYPGGVLVGIRRLLAQIVQTRRMRHGEAGD